MIRKWSILRSKSPEESKWNLSALISKFRRQADEDLELQLVKAMASGAKEKNNMTQRQKTIENSLRGIEKQKKRSLSCFGSLSPELDTKLL